MQLMTRPLHYRLLAIALSVALLGFCLAGCALIKKYGPTPVAVERPIAIEKGNASYYAEDFQGHTTASGERYDMHDLTAAHPKLKMGTRVRVTNVRNGRQVVVRINDRGPYHGGRIIDLSYEAARKLDMIGAGVVPVKVEVF
jgi:rare lipoprotein A